MSQDMPGPQHLRVVGGVASVFVCLFVVACQMGSSAVRPSIEFTTVPEAADGGSERLAPVSGRVVGARPGQKVVLFAKSGVWWVQPMTVHPFTTIERDSTWKSTIHLGTEYAALLVQDGYRPPAKTESLPPPGGAVVAVATMKGTGDYVAQAVKKLAFSGYDWEIRRQPSDRGGANDYDAANAWTDADGFLHLKIAQRAGRWTSAEVSLTRALGYGTYVFVVRDTAHLEPAAALGLLTWDEQGADQNHRELDVEISRWGDPAVKNGQYVLQPYYVAANVVRFAAPPGRLTHSFRWEPGKVSFTTMRDAGGSEVPVVARHDFTSGVPVPGSETVRMNLYIFRFSAMPLQKEVEVVIEKFQYLP
jgi:hypothetical protein